MNANAMPLSNDRLRNAEFATADDFQRLFASEMQELFHLALLLTADLEEAESCVICAMRDCMSVDSVSKEWTRTWARRAVVRNAIRITTGLREKLPVGDSDRECGGGTMAESSGVLTLDEFERLVYVICVVEHYPIRDCALLLGKSQHDVLKARSRALDQVAEFEQCARRTADPAASTLYPLLGSEQRAFNSSCGTLLN